MRRRGATFGIAGVVAVAVLAFPVAYMGSQETVQQVRVLDKERVCSGGERTSCEYRVYSEDETFVNKDSVLFRKFDSADVQGNLQADATYDLRVAGWRIPIFSAFRNIIEVEGAHG